MLGTVRYKYIENTVGVPLTLDNYVYGSDGDDKQRKVIVRKISTADIGIANGKTASQLGALVEAIPSTYNVLTFLGYVIRKQSIALSAVNAYNFIDNQYSVAAASSFEAEFILGLDNTLRVRSINDDLPFFDGDLVVFDLILGIAENANDKIND